MFMHSYLKTKTNLFSHIELLFFFYKQLNIIPNSNDIVVSFDQNNNKIAVKTHILNKKE